MGWMLTGLGVMVGGGTVGGMLWKTAGLWLVWYEVRGKEAVRVQVVVGCDGAPHWSQLSEARVEKTRQ